MVLGVCRRVLRHEADAEDAFQATFLVLVRKAGSIVPRGMVGNWLYGVAQNTARKAKAMNTRTRAREREAGARPKPEAASQDWQQQQLLLDQGLQSLPDKYRAPIVLCDLEGKSIKEAAHHLDCPPGTIGTRLARGRRKLARGLARRGLTSSGGAIATVLSQNAASASVSLPLLTSTIKAACLFAREQAASGVVGAKAAALTEGVLKAMLLTKLKIATAVLIGLAALGAGLAGLKDHARAVEPARVKPTEHDKDAKAENPAPKPDSKDEVPPWMKEFRKIYSLADGEVLKRISKFPECRTEYIKHSPQLLPGTEKVPITMALRQKETGGELLMWGFGGGDGTIFTTMWHIGIPMGEVEADKKLLDTPIGGDIVFRQEAPVEKLVPALERILREECKLAVKLTFKEVEREVMVVRGTLKIVPLEGQEQNHIEVFGKEIGKGEAWGSRKDLHGFLLDLGGFLGRRILNDAKSGKEQVFTYGLSVRQNPRQRLASELDRPSPLDPIPLPKFDPAIEAQDRDPKLVLPNVAKQTGLTFTTEKRKVRVLFVEKSDM
jgi:RNA polymerase sigma factor (sigma-70 family)